MIDAERAEYDDVIRRLTEKLQQLLAENAALKSNATAHQTLKEIYADANQPTGHRIKAAAASLPHEVPKLQPVPPPLDLVAEPIEPLASVVARQRARADRMLLEDPAFLAVRSFRSDAKGNGQDDDTGS